MSIWKEIRTEYQEGDTVFVDGYLTGDDNEEGKVIAKVNISTLDIEYLDDNARTDSYAQEMIQDVTSK